jgi:3-hydroxyisobutyrate dehydrogenase-like beta-hydroxyacid dehydrogenase
MGTAALAPYGSCLWDLANRREHSMNLGFVGLGNMGRAMAGTLLRAGHAVAVWDRTPAKAEELVKDGARLASSPADAARGAEAALSSLADDHAVLAVVLGDDGSADRPGREPLIRGLPGGATHVSLSTISPSLSRQLDDAHRAAGQGYVAAPVLGRPEAAERGELVLLAAGQDDAVSFCAPLFDVLGRKTYRLGSRAEHANVMKLSANLVMACLLEVFGETYALAESYGLGATRVLDVLKDSMLSPEAIAEYGERIANSQFEPAGFRLKLGLKDVDLALYAAEAAALQLPFASAVRDRFLVAIARGLEDKDCSAVARTLPHKRAA